MTTEAELIGRYITQELMLGSERELEPEQSLISTGILDSLALMQVILFLETEFAIKVEDGEVIPEHFQTIGRITRFVKSKQQASAAG